MIEDSLKKHVAEVIHNLSTKIAEITRKMYFQITANMPTMVGFVEQNLPKMQYIHPDLPSKAYKCNSKLRKTGLREMLFTIYSQSKKCLLKFDRENPRGRISRKARCGTGCRSGRFWDLWVLDMEVS